QLDRADSNPLVTRAGRSTAFVASGEVVQTLADVFAAAAGAEAARDVDAQSQFALLLEVEIRVERTATAVGVGDAGESVLVVKREQLQHRGPALRSSALAAAGHALQHAVCVPEHARWLAGLLVLHHLARGRVFGVFRHAGDFQRLAVGDARGT